MCDVPGVVGHDGCHIGVVEPHVRNTLHTHMMVQLDGSATMMVCWRRNSSHHTSPYMAFAASICFHGAEGRVAYVCDPVAMYVR